MADNDTNGKKTASLDEYRKKVKQKKLLVKLIIILFLFIGAMIIAVNIDNITESLRGVASKIDTKTSSDVGYPIKLSGSASYDFKRFGDSFSLLSDTYLYTYAMNGGQNYALKHSYSKPVHCSNSRRILLYDKDYNDFSLYSKTRLIYKGEVEEKIVFGVLSDNDSAAIVTNSKKYSNIIYIYNGKGEWKYTRKFLDENVMNIGFSSDDKYIYTVTMGTENGDIYSMIYKYDINSEEEAIWSCKITKSSIPLNVYVEKNRVCVIFDNYCLSLNESDGTMQGEKELQGIVTSCDRSDSMIGVIYYDSSANKSVMMSLDYDINVIGSGIVYPHINQLIVDGDTMYIMQTGKISGYDSRIQQIYEKSIADDYVSFLKIDNSFLLLGYNNINKEDL